MSRVPLLICLQQACLFSMTWKSRQTKPDLHDSNFPNSPNDSANQFRLFGIFNTFGGLDSHGKSVQYRIFNIIYRDLQSLSSLQDAFLLPCQWKYWHRAKNRLRDKTGFRMYNPQNVEKSGFGQSVCVSVCLSVLLSLFPRALTGVRFNRSSRNFRGMFGYMGHCAVPIFEAIRDPVYKII